MKHLIFLFFFSIPFSHASDIFHERGQFETKGFGCDSNVLTFTPGNSQFNHKFTHQHFSLKMNNRDCILTVAQYLKNEFIELDVVRNETFSVHQESVPRIERYCRWHNSPRGAELEVCSTRTVHDTQNFTYLEEWIGIDVGGGDFYLRSSVKKKVNPSHL